MARIKHNWKWKVISLLIGFFLWSFVMGEVNPSQSLTLRDIKVDVTMDPAPGGPEYVISDVEPKMVALTLVGKRDVISTFQRSAVTATAHIDAGNLKEGTQTLTIRYQYPDALSAVSESETRNATVTLERVISKKVNVKMVTDGELSGEYILEDMVSVPDYVQVRGPRSNVEKVAHMEARVDLQGVTSDQTTNLSIQPVDEEGEPVEGVTASTTTTNVALTVSKIKEVPIEIDQVGEMAANMQLKRIQVYPNTVRIKGKQEEVDRVEKIRTDRVDLSKVTGDLDQDISLVYPDGIAPVTENFKTRLTAAVETKKEKRVEIPVSSIEVKPPAAGLQFAFDSPTAKLYVSVEGFDADLERVDAAKLRPSVDLTELGEGKHRVEVKVDAPESVTVRLDPPQIGITISTNP